MVRADRGWRVALAPALLVACGAAAAGGETTASPTLAVTEIAAGAGPAVVMLRVRAAGGREWRQGTGFLVDPGGTIVTALHLIDSADKLLVRTAAGESYRPVGIRAFDAASDVAVLQIDGEELPVLEVGDTSGLSSGAPIVVVGNPLGLEGTVTEGIVSAWREPVPPPEELPIDDLEEDEEFGERQRVRALPNARVLQISAQIGPGTSGAPVLDRSGQVVGMAVVYGPVDLNFAIPSELIAPLLETDEGLTLASLRRRVDLAREDQAVPHIERARLALELGRGPEARRELDAALQLHPHSAEALLLESERLRRSGDLEAAKQSLLRATHHNPQSEEAWVRLGELYLEIDGGSGHALALARRALERARELGNDLEAAERGLGKIAYRQGRYLSALRLLERAAELDQDQVETPLWLGEVYLRTNRPTDARAAFERALELASDDPRAHHGLARTSTTLGLDGTGREHWRRFLELTEGDPEFEAVRERTVLYLRRYPHLMPIEFDHLLEPGAPIAPPT